jgi:DeoR/GlpR family transcriptional regulator of sugar metabolism
MMRTGSVPARRRFELIRLAQRKVSSQGGSSSAQRNGSRIAEKKRIAQCASELIEDGESVILNGGSTTRLFAFELGGKRISR